MDVFLAVPTSTFLALQQCGAMRREGDGQWRGYTCVPSRIQSAELSDDAEENMTILSLNVPVDEVTRTVLTEKEKEVFAVRRSTRKNEAVLFPELCLSFVTGQEMFLNTGHISGKPECAAEKSACRILESSLEKYKDSDALHKACCILSAGDILVWKAEYQHVYLNPSECAEFCNMVSEILSDDDGSIAAELGISSYGMSMAGLEKYCNRVCEQYFSLQYLASERMDATAAGKILDIFEREIPFRLPVTVTLRNSALPYGADMENSYRIFVDARRGGKRMYRALRTACYILRTREQSLIEEKHADSPQMVLSVTVGGRKLATVTWENDRFHIINEVIRSTIIGKH